MAEKSPRHSEKRTPAKKEIKSQVVATEKVEVCIFKNENADKRVFPPLTSSEKPASRSKPGGKKEVPAAKHKDRLNKQLDNLPAVTVEDPLVKYKVVDPLDFYRVPLHVRQDSDSSE